MQVVFRKTDKLDCGANFVLFNAPKMLGALRATATVLKKNVAKKSKNSRRESWWIAIEVTINHTPKIILSAHLPSKRLPLKQLTATLEELDTILGVFPKHEVLMRIDANAKLAGHSDGLTLSHHSPLNSQGVTPKSAFSTFFHTLMDLI